MAHHLIEANLTGPAIDYLLAAGTLALTRSADAEAVEHLRLGLAFPFTTALALAHATIVGILASDAQRLGAYLDDAISFSAKHGLPEPEQKARFMRGAFLARTGDPATGLEIMRHAMAAESQAVPGHIAQYHSLYVGQMADAHFRLGDARTGLGLLETAIADTAVTGERFFLVELFRRQARMLLAPCAAEQAEASLHEALAIAQQQAARCWELRAATTLAAVWHGEGRSVNGSGRKAARDRSTSLR